MSLRKKLIISNILVFLIPLVFSVLAVHVTDRSFESRYGYGGDFAQYRQIIRFYTANDIDAVVEICQNLERGGYYVDFISNGDTVYQSADFNSVCETLGMDKAYAKSPEYLVFTNEYGDMYCFTVHTENNKMTFSLLTDRTGTFLQPLAFMDSDIEYTRNMVGIVLFSTVTVIIITILSLTYLISRSILKPLKLLKEGAGQIKNGNLSFKLNYKKNDEFGSAIECFEDMRLGLIALKDEERKYEENRKELIAEITHDLNTPITAIKGFASGLLEGIANTPEKKEAYLKNIKQTADNMSKLVEKMLLYSTLDMDALPFSFMTIDLSEYFKDCIAEYADEFKNSGMRLDFEAANGPVFADIDCERFKCAVLNILSNSAKYKKGDTGNIRITLKTDNAYAVISFKDNGIGVAKDEITDIFKVFYRTDKSRSKPAAGSGLGLVIVTRIIAAHNGEVCANPEYTEGLEVIIRLPLAKGGDV